ncbi:MAG: hypothetical protein JKY52_15640 [Flavobacteriales bacterium]|nr:hypothetical protein [Flavobacteriales bacterium]
MKKVIPSIVFILIILLFVVWGAFYSTIKIEGRVYTVVDKDTIYLNKVQVHLIVKEGLEREENMLSYNRWYWAYTDSNGYFLHEIGFVPYEANYTLEFEPYQSKYSHRPYQSKYSFKFNQFNYLVKIDTPCCNRTVIKKTMRFSNHMNLEVRLNPYNKKIDIIGHHDELNFDWSHRHATAITWFMLLSVISLPFILWFFPFRWLIDTYRKGTRNGFKGLSAKKKEAFLKEGFCESCMAYNGMHFDREEDVMGMVFIYGTCDACKEPIKVRIK